MEKRLSRPIPALAADLSLPPELAARVAGGGGADGSGAAQYGQQRGAGGSGVSQEGAERVRVLAPAVRELARLEVEAQTSFFDLQRRWPAVA